MATENYFKKNMFKILDTYGKEICVEKINFVSPEFVISKNQEKVYKSAFFHVEFEMIPFLSLLDEEVKGSEKIESRFEILDL